MRPKNYRGHVSEWTLKKTTSAQVTQNLQFLNRITDCICHCLLKSYCQRQSPSNKVLRWALSIIQNLKFWMVWRLGQFKEVLRWGISIKGQLLSKCRFVDFNFFQKTNKNTSHSSKNEFIRLFFGRIHGLTICIWN